MWLIIHPDHTEPAALQGPQNFVVTECGNVNVALACQL